MELSRSQVDAAGRRIRHAIRDGRQPAEPDLAVVAEFRAAHLDSVLELEAVLTNLRQLMSDELRLGQEHPWAIAARAKTEDAIVAKLRRSTTSLSSMQDIAGARLVVPTLDLQDFALEILTDVMLQRAHDPKVEDTREEGDELGYRAIHQDGWAQTVELPTRRLEPT